MEHIIKRYNGKTYIIPKEFEKETRKDERTKVIDKVIYILHSLQNGALINALEEIDKLKGNKNDTHSNRKSS